VSKLFLLYTTFLVGLLYLLLPQTVEPQDYFLFSDMKLHFATHIYFICEKAILIVLGYVVASEAVEYREAIWIFFWLLVLDLVDYLLTYSTVWIDLDGFPVSMNTLKAVIFGGVIIREIWKRHIL
jgi:hypothetical protein